MMPPIDRTARRRFQPPPDAGHCANGFGLLGLAGILAEAQSASAAEDASNLSRAARPPHHAPQAKRVIFSVHEGRAVARRPVRPQAPT